MVSISNINQLFLKVFLPVVIKTIPLFLILAASSNYILTLLSPTKLPFHIFFTSIISTFQMQDFTPTLHAETSSGTAYTLYNTEGAKWISNFWQNFAKSNWVLPYFLLTGGVEFWVFNCRAKVPNAPCLAPQCTIHSIYRYGQS